MQSNILDYLYATAARVPEKIAYSDGTDSLSFKQLYTQCRSIGSFLAKEGVYKKPVVVFMNKHPHIIAAYMGIVAGGDFYVPIDAEMPRSRMELILQNVQAPIMICDESSYELTKELDFQGKAVLYTDICTTEIDEAALDRIYHKTIDTDPVYILFTSGSTGIPKGVACCHRSIIEYIDQLCEVCSFREDMIFGNQTPLYVDACLKEIYSTMKLGATTYLIPKNLFLFPIKLVEYLNEYKINAICWVVSALVMVSAFDTFKTVKPEYLKLIVFGGEVFPVKQYNRWKENVPEADFYNLYGPTEGTGVCCHYKVDREFAEGEVIPIGTNFYNTDILLLTPENKQAAEGETGEICIRGTSVALGYYNNPEKTAESFVQNPLNTSYPELIYRTGDLARVNERGELEFVSRKDYQIKHMGHRIELGEIEMNVDRIPQVRMSCVIYDKESNKMVLFYVGDIADRDLVKQLKTTVPRYMVPNKIYKLESMPLTGNGKLDRVKLKNMYLEEK